MTPVIQLEGSIVCTQMVTSGDEDLPTAQEQLTHEAAPSTPRSVLGFVVLYCLEAPSRVGAFMGLPDGARRIFGRGASRASDEHVRLQLLFQRPGENVPLPPFESASLSRLQLEVHRAGNEIEITNLGQCVLAINGQQAKRARVTLGDLVAIGGQLLLLCVERPQEIAGDASDTNHILGDADEHGFVGESPEAWQLRHEIRTVASRNGHVIIHGPSGTGKELVASAIHRLSRPGKPWVTRSAGTFPDTLIDAELYGNARNYPNTGMPERKGLIGAADRSSLFLDEFAELPIAAQTHLLRVMDGGEYQRLGETNARFSEFRLIAATNRPLTDLRLDVLARFAFRIEVPPLATRREDIPLLARHLLRVLAKDEPSIISRFFVANEPKLTPRFVAELVRLPLDGNARELRNLLWTASSTGHGNALDLPASATAQPTPASGTVPDITALQLQAALEANGGSLEKTWRALGLKSRFILMRLMKKNGLQIKKQPRRT
jgi:DNA-binding NtrC family response regulator